MPTVTGTVAGAGAGITVIAELVPKTVTFLDGAVLVTARRVVAYTTSNGAWAMGLTGNTGLTPSDSRWRITEYVGAGRGYHIEVPSTGGPYVAADIVTDPPQTGGGSNPGGGGPTTPPPGNTALDDHLADPTDAHDASAVSVSPISGVSGDDVQEVLAALRAQIAAIPAVSGDGLDRYGGRYEWPAGTFADNGANPTRWPDGGLLNAADSRKWYRPVLRSGQTVLTLNTGRLTLKDVQASTLASEGVTFRMVRANEDTPTVLTTLCTVTIAQGTQADATNGLFTIERDVTWTVGTIAAGDIYAYIIDSAPAGNQMPVEFEWEGVRT